MDSLNFEVARTSMILNQMRAWLVHDDRVLELIARMPRQDYVPAACRNLAYADMNIPLGHGEVMMAPKLEARLVQELEINPADKILEIGTGSGFMTALLAALGRHVISVEIRPEFTVEAATRLAHHGVRNITLETGDGARGWDRQQPYDVILLTGSTPILPAAFQQSLAIGGRLIAIVGTAPAMEVRRIRRLGEHSFEEKSLFETVIPKLQNALEPARFVF
ncbi:protein-L-isoaspartate O-methyltransferase [Sulfuricaulis limicola]|uniref:Protein-L-isoaspartate O-methyltransferase n=1 Tax=Sulfuricaulis limicola TaxID=1620215 RepID=A0A1B4XJG7_9GAMM|nr:protein-L-isoaspartate O-methyltransferase [Sulfuricaulis limicola]BAV34956.1 protein-L-isoaspartate O-methyltransferase [Sulfuricaulis limicola]